MLPNVQQTTIKPVIAASVVPGTVIHTDEYDIYARLPAWGYGHKTVCQAHGEYARDDDGDGFCAVHVNTIEGFWSLLCSWLPPHRRISRETLPLYPDFFQFVHNARRRGRARPAPSSAAWSDEASHRPGTRQEPSAKVVLERRVMFLFSNGL